MSFDDPKEAYMAIVRAEGCLLETTWSHATLVLLLLSLSGLLIDFFA